MTDTTKPSVANLRRVAHLSRFNPERCEVLLNLARLEMHAEQTNDEPGLSAVAKAWQVFYAEEYRVGLSREEAAGA